MNYRPAKRLDNVKMSSIRIMMEKAQALREQGHQVIPLSAGEPNFNTPEEIKAQTKIALDNNETHYSSNRGNLKLRQEISKFLKENTNVEYDPNTEIIVTAGCEEALHNTIHSLIDPGDEVIIFTPAFVSYVSLVQMCGGIPIEVPLKAEDQFQINSERLKEAITSKTKCIVMNNPNNPTGSVYTEEVLKAVCDIAIENDLLVLSDEVYSAITYEQEFKSVASFPGMKERTFVINGFSKMYAMTGWRLGYVACDEKLVEGVLRIHQYSSTSCSTFSQVGLAEAMSKESVKQDVKTMVTAFSQRRNEVMKQLDSIENLSYVKPQGAFYIMVDVSKTGLTGQEFADQLLEKEHVATVPAVGLGKECVDFVRISFASSMEDIQEGFARIAHFCEK